MYTYVATLQAQQIIKVGDEKTITCNGTFIAEVQNFYLDGTPSSKSRAFVDVIKDTLVFYTALIKEDRENQVVIVNKIAKKDVDMDVFGFSVAEVIENRMPFQMLAITSIDGNSVITEEKHSNDEVEVSENTNRVHVYFLKDKVSEAKAWAEKIKQLVQL